MPEMYITHVDKLKISVRPHEHSKSILAFCDISLISDDKQLFIIRGITLQHKMFNDVKKLSVSFPAYRTKGGKFYKSFLIDNKTLYQDVCNMIIDEYCKIKGIQKENTEEEVVNPEDIPF